ncbi:MAG: hypothetical protein GXY83_00680 [Rhodopirellula sp.]|nr:hypothetical protein [Rhodopirellula sp.]
MPCRICPILGSLLLIGVGFTTGCKPIDLSPSQDWFGGSDSDPRAPTSLTAVWSPAMLERTDGTRARGFGGRLMFYQAKSQNPVRVDGALIVYAYDEEAGNSADSRPSRKYVFTREQFATHYSKSDLGHSYSVWIPWDKMGGEARQVSLVVRFTPIDGSTIVSEPSKVTLPGNTPLIEQQIHTESQPTRPAATGLVQPASHEAFVSEQARQSKESTGRQMETATIRIPRRGDN